MNPDNTTVRQFKLTNSAAGAAGFTVRWHDQLLWTCHALNDPKLCHTVASLRATWPDLNAGTATEAVKDLLLPRLFVPDLLAAFFVAGLLSDDDTMQIMETKAAATEGTHTPATVIIPDGKLAQVPVVIGTAGAFSLGMALMNVCTGGWLAGLSKVSSIMRELQHVQKARLALVTDATERLDRLMMALDREDARSRNVPRGTAALVIPQRKKPRDDGTEDASA